MFRLFIYSIFFISLSFLISEDLQAQNYPIAMSVKPEIDFAVYHYRFDSSTIYFNLNPTSLLRIKPDSTTKFIKRFAIEGTYILLNDKKQTGSFSFNYIDTLENTTKYTIHDSINIALPVGTYNLIINTKDLNRNTITENTLLINKEDPSTINFFHLTNLNGTTPCSAIINTDDILIIKHLNPQIKKLYVDYINNDYPSVDPPFILYPEDNDPVKIDSSFVIDVPENGYTYLHFKKNGIYHIRIDTAKKNGFVLSKYHLNFPRVTDAKQLILPLKYITSRAEYKKLTEAPNPKLVLDEFWITKAKSQDRARKAIQRFYARVEYANTVFTSYKEGWKTDRGCIFIVYGVPTSVNYNLDEEVWNYGEPDNINSLKFIFNKKQNTYTTNQYQLERSTSFKNSWFISTDNWQ